MFTGYARAWGSGQLEDELERDDWIVSPRFADDAFTDAPEELSADVLRGRAASFQLVARMPEDPSVN